MFGRRAIPELAAFLEEQPAAKRAEVPPSKSSMRQVLSDNGTNIWMGMGGLAARRCATPAWSGRTRSWGGAACRLATPC